MGDKFDGTLAYGSDRLSDREGFSVWEAVKTLSIAETLVTLNENDDVVLLRAVQNPDWGGLMIVADPEDNTALKMIEAITQSQMTSMLTDNARCSKYAEAIEKALQTHPQGRVLDIGTGTGLLAMLAARAGAGTVDGVEMFSPMADLARKIVASNNLSAKVNIHSARSTDMTVGTRLDLPVTEDMNSILPHRADVLVTEIFDSALLGEGCIPAIAHAHQHLLQKDALVIPAKATMYGLVISSGFCRRFHDFGHDFPLYRKPGDRKCNARAAGIPIHLEALKEGEDYEALSEVFPIFTFDFSEAIVSKRFGGVSYLSIDRIRKGEPDAVLLWWELDLLGNGQIKYSSKAGAEGWQDHWLPVAYPLGHAENVKSDESVIDIVVNHTDSAIVFKRGKTPDFDTICSCGLHAALETPNRIFEVGNQVRLGNLSSRIAGAIQAVCNRVTEGQHRTVRCLDISDGGICAALAGRVEASVPLEVSSVDEDNELGSFVFSQIANVVKAERNEVFIEHESLQSYLEREEKRKIEEGSSWSGVDVLLSEPYTRAMQAYPIATLGNLIVQRVAVSEYLNEGFTCVPRLARIYAQLVRFPTDTIQNSFKTVTSVQGFDHSDFEDLFDRTDWKQRERRLSFPLYQYRPISCSEKTVVQSVDMVSSDGGVIPKARRSKVCVSGGEPEMVVLWVAYDDQPPTRVQRYETLWLSDGERNDITRKGGVWLSCSFAVESGTWVINMEPLEE